MKLKRYQKKILSILAIAAGGYVLFNLAFLLTALVTNALIGLSGMSQSVSVHIIGIALSAFLILSISWAIFRSRLNDTIKAAFLTMPLMVILVIIGIILNQQSKWIIAGIGAAIIFAVVLYLHKKKFPWQYFFSVFYVAAIALYVLLSGMDI
ncbi:MAG: hypothetical protein VB112_01355 [Oscillospiraceae bacterium]|nr:hypothetical protein [Oscillospiraceae bacterium]